MKVLPVNVVNAGIRVKWICERIQRKDARPLHGNSPYLKRNRTLTYTQRCHQGCDTFKIFQVSTFEISLEVWSDLAVSPCLFIFIFFFPQLSRTDVWYRSVSDGRGRSNAGLSRIGVKRAVTVLAVAAARTSLPLSILTLDSRRRRRWISVTNEPRLGVTRCGLTVDMAVEKSASHYST